MYKQIVEKLKYTFKNLDKKNIRILKIGLKICFLIAVLSISLLITYLFFIHSVLIYEIGMLILQISLYYAIFFIASSITIDSIQKNLI